MVIQSKEVITSRDYEEHLIEILDYSIENFGYAQSCKYFNILSHLVEKLATDYTQHPECRYLATKNRVYRNIILDAHLVIYRVTNECIEVLDVIHSASSIGKIRSVRKIRL